jgi:hypothetical protein
MRPNCYCAVVSDLGGIIRDPRLGIIDLSVYNGSFCVLHWRLLFVLRGMEWNGTERQRNLDPRQLTKSPIYYLIANLKLKYVMNSKK